MKNQDEIVDEVLKIAGEGFHYGESIYGVIRDALNIHKTEMIKQFHNALDEVVSFDDDNQKSNFIIDVLNKLK